MDHAPDAEVQLELEALQVVLAVVEVDPVRRCDDGMPADARQERSQPVGVVGITKKELHAAAPILARALTLGQPSPGGFVEG